MSVTVTDRGLPVASWRTLAEPDQVSEPLRSVETGVQEARSVERSTM